MNTVKLYSTNCSSCSYTTKFKCHVLSIGCAKYAAVPIYQLFGFPASASSLIIFDSLKIAAVRQQLTKDSELNFLFEVKMSICLFCINRAMKKMVLEYSTPVPVLCIPH